MWCEERGKTRQQNVHPAWVKRIHCMLNLVGKVGPDYKEPQGLTALCLCSTAGCFSHDD